ncbi:ATP-binding protein [Thermococcus sp.]|uniref:ATP-binding protein n=1 Tax=Thermococcus sp. TaxID=35749 RepID=UPI00262D3891|nr:ATP-binding protein [Thermococcus sp.]
MGVVREVVEDYLEVEVEGVERELEVPLPRVPRAIAITGPRRAGKSFYMLQKFKRLLSRIPALYLPLDDDRLYPPTLDTLREFLEVFHETYGEGRGVLFLDEVQEVQNWELFIKRAISLGHTVFVSGSSSKLLSREIATQLRGRGVSFELYPFSFREFLRARSFEPSESLPRKARTKALLEEYLRWGGFPEVVLEDSELLKRKTLEGYVDLILYRDVVERFGVKNTRALRLLLRLIGSSFGREFSINRTARYMRGMGVEANRNTLSAYLEHLEDAYMVVRVRKLAPPRESEKALPKVYLIDTGLARVFKENLELGRLMESAVLTELLRRGVKPYYLKTQKFEVDFVIREGDSHRLIQVTRSPEGETLEREIKALREASKLIPVHEKTLITWDDEGEIEGVRLTPLWRWLLGVKP